MSEKRDLTDEARLSPKHAELIRASSISEDVARARGYRTVTKKAELRELGFSDAQRRVPALLAPVWSVTGDNSLNQIRPDEPRVKDGKPLKYETPAGARLALDVPPPIRGQLADPSTPLFITEGVRKADSAASHGLCCIALLGVWGFRGKNEHGGLTALPDWELIALKGRKAYVCFDSDVMEKDAVRLAMKRLRSFLELRGADVCMIYLPVGVGGAKVGLDDFFAAGGTVEELMSMASSELRGDTQPQATGGRKSQATVLVELAGDAELFHTPDGEPFATFAVGDHFETWPLKSRGFRDWLVRRFYEVTRKSPNSQAYQDALGVLSGRARFDGDQREVHTRVAAHDGALFLDLADETWRVVRIGRNGWEVISGEGLPVRFRRPRGTLPLPEPSRGGRIDALRSLINVTDEDWPLAVAWLVATFRSGFPFPVLAVYGEQGSAKSTMTEVLCALIDPRKPALRSEPRDVRDLMIAAHNCWVVPFDNVSHVQHWLSDALCRLTTGAGFATRELYTDSEEMLFDAMRPVALNGITELVTRPDLLDRTVIVNLPTIPEERRKTEDGFWREFDSAHPSILGALLDAVSAALRNVAAVRIDRLPRMADFALWATAAETALGLETGAFMRAYKGNRAAANDLALEASPVASTIIAFVEQKTIWTGTASDLLKELNRVAGEDVRRQDGWPKSPQAMGGALRRLAPSLRSVGVGVRYGGGRARRKVTLEKGAHPLSRLSPSSPVAVSAGVVGDDEWNWSDEARESSPCLSPCDAGNDVPGDNGVRRDNGEPLVSGVVGTENAERYDEEIIGASEPSPPCLVALDCETEAFDERRGVTPRNAKMIGLAVAYDGERADYFTDPSSWPFLMPEPEQRVVFHNTKFDLGVLRRTGLPLPVDWEDTFIAAKLLDENGEHGLKPLAKRLLGVEPVTFEEADRGKLIDPRVFEEYARNDARYTHRLWQILEPQLEAQDLVRVYELEKRLVPAVMDMEEAGMRVDLVALKEMGTFIKSETARIEEEVYESAGCRFDLHSPRKVAAILYDKLGLPCPKATGRGARSVDHEALSEISGRHEAVAALLEYRELDKLAGAFVCVLPKYADEGGRVHAEYNQLGAKSGRFSCRHPNLQQVPARSELGKRLRCCFVAADGHRLVVADWSQMELRVLAHYSRDPILLEAYTSAEETDLHALTAGRMFGKPPTEVSKTERTIAKMINFGIAYGISATGLFNRLRAQGVKVMEEECGRFIASYFDTYRRVREFLARAECVLKERGFVKSLYGRRRRLAGRTRRETRQAQNFIIQATAADLCKQALVDIHAALPQGARMVAQVHDEIVIECPAEQAEDVRQLAVEMMERLPEGFAVPLKVDARVVERWGDAK